MPSFGGFAVLADRSRAEQLLSWKMWLAVIAWILLVLAAARPERIGDEVEVPVSGRNLMLAVDLSGSMDQKDFELGARRVDRSNRNQGSCERLYQSPRGRPHRSDSVR